MKSQQPNFDRIAWSYRLLEYLSMGRALERTRFTFLEEVANARRALVLGDGDGRFTARLFLANKTVRITAIDVSKKMLQLLRERCAQADDRLTTVQDDAITFCQSTSQRYDLVVAHFFLDCLSQPEVDELARLLVMRSSPGATLLLSEFAVPRGALRIPAQVLIRGLYIAFRAITGLRTSHIPDYTRALASAGFVRIEERRRLGGILRAERWMLRE